MAINNLLIGGSSLLALMSIFLIVFLVNFYRNPERKIPKGNLIVSPADGRVISIVETNQRSLRVKKGYLGKIRSYTKEVAPETKVISIFMSPLDVHYNRAPIKGTVVSVRHTRGKFFKAYDLEKSLLNEKNEIIIKNELLTIKVIQIAGFLARRIQCFVAADQKVDKGQILGRIVLGSQATLILPSKVKLKVKEGD